MINFWLKYEKTYFIEGIATLKDLDKLKDSYSKKLLLKITATDIANIKVEYQLNITITHKIPTVTNKNLLFVDGNYIV